MSKFTYEIKTDNDKNQYIEITGQETDEGETASIIDIPEAIEVNPAEGAEDDSSAKSLPVRAIGNHAFSSRKDIKEVMLPDSIDTILGFAFHNCSNLRKISLTDGVKEFLDGSTRQCDSLEIVDVTIKRNNYEIVRSILGDNDRRLTFFLHSEGKDEAILVFPGFNYDFVENTMARTIQFAIEGTGYAYRECVKSSLINFREYDNLFSKASADDSVTAEMIAVARLLAPYELSEDNREIYLNWLKKNAYKNLTRLINNKKTAISFMEMEDVIDFYIKRKLIESDVAKKLTHLSSERGLTAIVSLLMEYNNDSNDTSGDNGLLELDF